MAKLQ